jgi:hypothetical protein
MILEYAQLLSTAHRVLDGDMVIGVSKTGRKQTRYVLPDSREPMLYTATHVNHPSAIWVRKSFHNYEWLHRLLHNLCKEYTHRYGKIHKVERIDLLKALRATPNKLKLSRNDTTFTEPPPAMPDIYKVDDIVQSYHNYYNYDKSRFAKWTNRNPPDWYEPKVA